MLGYGVTQITYLIFDKTGLILCQEITVKNLFLGRATAVSALLATGILVLPACGASPEATEETSPTASEVTISATPSTSPSESVTEPQSSSSSLSASPTESNNDTPLAGSSASSTDGTVLRPDQKGKNLTLSEFFSPTNTWAENRYSVAGETNVSGIAGEIDQCGNSYGSPEKLELRLANSFDQLSFKAGQADQSESSKQTLVVRAVGNGNQIDIQRIPFNKIQEFTLNVSDVNALELEFLLDEDVTDCSRLGKTTAVVWDIELQ